MTEPDHRLLTYEWASATGGALDATERRQVRTGIRQGLWHIATGLAMWPLRRTGEGGDLPVPPDSKLAKAAAEAAVEQGPALAGHGYRTWLAGRALAEHDHVRLDEELFFVAALLHDAGMTTRQVGQDFTVRSARVILEVCEKVGTGPEASTKLADAAVSNATPGIRVDQDPLGYYIARGATADLAGFWRWDLPRHFLRRAYEAYPAMGIHREVVGLIRREAEDVPLGRFAQLHKYGLALTVQVSPTRRYRQR